MFICEIFLLDLDFLTNNEVKINKYTEVYNFQHNMQFDYRWSVLSYNAR